MTTTQVERLARNTWAMEEDGAENGELLSLRDHEDDDGGGGRGSGAGPGGVGEGGDGYGGSGIRHQQEDGVKRRDSYTSGQGDGCCDNFLRCLSLVPCPSLLSWILLLCGLGCLTGSLLFGTWHTRDLLEDDSLLWFMEYTVIGVMSGMFVFGCLVLTASHLSTEPTSRRVFNSFTKNKCAQGMNIFALIVSFMLAMCWVLVTAIFAAPVLSIIALLIVNPDSLDLGDFGFNGGVKTGPELDTFKKDCRELLISWGVVFVSSVMIVKSLICFIICVTANITHLRDNRFSTLNAYGSEEVRNSKHSVLDTNM